jgi:hypothetical protein
MMKLYCGIDLHSSNSVVVVLDEAENIVYQKRLGNGIAIILRQLSEFCDDIVAINEWRLSNLQVFLCTLILSLIRLSSTA